MLVFEETETVRQDMDGRVRAIAGAMARLRNGYALTQTLIERSQQQLSASRKLLGSAGPDRLAAAVASWRAEAMKKADQHVIDAELHVERQKLVLEQLRAKGQDSRSAARLLHTFQSALALYKAEVEALKKVSAPDHVFGQVDVSTSLRVQ